MIQLPGQPTDPIRKEVMPPSHRTGLFAESPADCVQSVDCLKHSLYGRNPLKHSLYFPQDSLHIQTVLLIRLRPPPREGSKTQDSLLPIPEAPSALLLLRSL